MKNSIETIVQNASALSFISNTNVLLVAVYLYNNGKETKADEISKFYNFSIKEVIQYLEILEKNGLIKKISRLDRSKKPPYLNNFYKIDEKKFEDILVSVKNVAESCLNKSS
ncbi:MAG: hypothetical protein ACRENO_02315 [Thermodesulfobacteriota bacterium]